MGGRKLPILLNQHAGLHRDAIPMVILAPLGEDGGWIVHPWFPIGAQIIPMDQDIEQCCGDSCGVAVYLAKQALIGSESRWAFTKHLTTKRGNNVNVNV